MKKILFQVPDSEHCQIRVRAAQSGISMAELCRRAIRAESDKSTAKRKAPQSLSNAHEQ